MEHDWSEGVIGATRGGTRAARRAVQKRGKIWKKTGRRQHNIVPQQRDSVDSISGKEFWIWRLKEERLSRRAQSRISRFTKFVFQCTTPACTKFLFQ